MQKISPKILPEHSHLGRRVKWVRPAVGPYRF